MLIGALIMAVSLNKQLAVVLAVTIPILLITQAIVISKGFPRFSRMQEKIDGLNSNVQESLTNVRVIKSFVREDHEKKRFRKSNKGLKDAGISAMNIMIIMSPLMSLIMNATTIAVVYLGSKYVTLGNMTVGNLAAFITYINQILFSLMMVTFLFMMSSRALASAKRIKEVLEEDLDISDEDATCKDKTVENGDIEFRNVSFRYYKTSEDKVLDTINLKIKGGETVGIIGSTGCGKTTLVSLIPRLYDTDEGEVLVDGTNVKDYSLKNLREGIGMVLQKNVLFSGTIEENLRWGDQDADMDTLRKAADHAQADGFVTSFTEGYQTELGQGGVNVSGGQKQRLCIARALLKKPKIIILDDSTSAVDTATEKKIREAFATELAGTTKIIIAQRISSVMEADKIIVINDGVITGMGTHDELIENNTEYQEIYNSQMDSKKEGEK
jgi:ATP-binding cassette subfamily B protein